MAFVHTPDTANPYELDGQPSPAVGNRVPAMRRCRLTQIPQGPDIVRDGGENAEAPMPWRKIYVGMLTQVAPHPNADREVVTEVEVGWGRLTIVTGGPHVEVGRKVAVALPGARVLDADSAIPRTRKLKKGRIRGVLSEGMLCSAKELGLSDDHSSIYVLSPNAPVGVPLGAWLTEDNLQWLT